MTHWNYRIVKSKDGDDDWFSVHSAYYEDEKIVSTSALPSQAGSNTIEGLKAELHRMLEALDKPIIEE